MPPFAPAVCVLDLHKRQNSPESGFTLARLIETAIMTVKSRLFGLFGNPHSPQPSPADLGKPSERTRLTGCGAQMPTSAGALKSR